MLFRSGDSRVNQNSNDPHSAVYISNRIDLKQPASSLKVLVGAYRHSSADFRVLYKLYKADSSEIEPTYELFPGYDNLNDTDGDGFFDGQEVEGGYNPNGPGRIIDPSNAQ